MFMKLVSLSAEHTIETGKRLGSLLRSGDVIALNGTLAAGKTTLARGIAQGLGITEPVTSPTFTLISEYSGRLPVYHMDVYRLDSVEDFINLGVEDMLYGDGVCIVEWSDRVIDVLPNSTIVITIALTDDSNQRIITIQNWPYGEITP